MTEKFTEDFIWRIVDEAAWKIEGSSKTLKDKMIINTKVRVESRARYALVNRALEHSLAAQERFDRYGATKDTFLTSAVDQLEEAIQYAFDINEPQFEVTQDGTRILTLTAEMVLASMTQPEKCHWIGWC